MVFFFFTLQLPHENTNTECWTEDTRGGGSICMRHFKHGGMCDYPGEFNNLPDCKDFLLIKLRDKKQKFMLERHGIAN